MGRGLPPQSPPRIRRDCPGLPGHDFVGVSGAGYYVCGLRSQGEVWFDYDEDDAESAAQVSGSFRALSVGEIYACALQADGAAKCWGHSGDISAFVADVRPVDPPPDASFASISVGRWHACGVRTDNVIECWGTITYMRSTAVRALTVCRSAAWSGAAITPDRRRLRLAYSAPSAPAARTPARFAPTERRSAGATTAAARPLRRRDPLPRSAPGVGIPVVCVRAAP